MNDQDLRVIKTRACIERALLELLETKPIEKITVAELARTAQINKGTFYLHYLDIMDLHTKLMWRTVYAPIDNADFFSDFFDAPGRFMEKLERAIVNNYPHMMVFFKEKSETPIITDVIRRLCEKVYETERLPRNADTGMRLSAFFGAMLTIMPEYFPEHRDKASALMVSMIRGFFPEETGQSVPEQEP